jgi:hypothetical protein
MPAPETLATVAIREVAALVAGGVPLSLAAQHWIAIAPIRAGQLMDILGAWPSSEPELAAIQRAYFRR